MMGQAIYLFNAAFYLLILGLGLRSVIALALSFVSPRHQVTAPLFLRHAVTSVAFIVTAIALQSVPPSFMESFTVPPGGLPSILMYLSGIAATAFFSSKTFAKDEVLMDFMHPAAIPPSEDAIVTAFYKALTVHPSFHLPLSVIFKLYYQKYNAVRSIDPVECAKAVGYYIGLLPSVYVYDDDGTPFIRLLTQNVGDEEADLGFLSIINGVKEMAADLRALTVRAVVPDVMRTEHHSVIAASGHGKTSLFKSMIVDDLEKDVCIIVIDSQRAVINQIAERVEPGRVVLIDPQTCPPALNLFSNIEKDEGAQGRALQMFDYIFSSKGVEFTNNQARLYRNLSRLCMAVPNASLVTMRDMCEPMGTLPYQHYIDTLDANTQSFFREYHLPKHGQYGGTRQEVLGRLQTALESTTFAKMLGANTRKLDLLTEIEQGKVILINTDKHLLQAGGAALMGRIFAGLVMQAVRSRPELSGKRVYLYIDEFADYASDDDLMIELFKQGRKYNLGMIVAFHTFDDLTPKLAINMSASTAIKMAGRVAVEDLNKVAAQLQTDTKAVAAIRKYSFLANFAGIGTILWPVQDGRLEAMPAHKEHVMDNLRARMRREYGEESSPPIPEAPPEPFKDAF